MGAWYPSLGEGTEGRCRHPLIMMDQRIILVGLTLAADRDQIPRPDEKNSWLMMVHDA